MRGLAQQIKRFIRAAFADFDQVNKKSHGEMVGSRQWAGQFPTRPMRHSPSDNQQQAAGKGALYYPCEHRVAVLHCGLYIPNEPRTVDTIKPREGGFSVWSRLAGVDVG